MLIWHSDVHFLLGEGPQLQALRLRVRMGGTPTPSKIPGSAPLRLAIQGPLEEGRRRGTTSPTFPYRLWSTEWGHWDDGHTITYRLWSTEWGHWDDAHTITYRLWSTEWGHWYDVHTITYRLWSTEWGHWDDAHTFSCRLWSTEWGHWDDVRSEATGLLRALLAGPVAPHTRGEC